MLLSSPSCIFKTLAETNSEEVLREIHKQYFKKLYRFIYGWVGNNEITEELVSDVFIQLWQKKQLFQNARNPEVYLFVTAKNIVLKHLKRSRLLTEELTDIHDTHISFQPSPHDRLVNSELAKRINEAINSLPPRCKLVFSLVKENQLPYKNVALLLDVSEKTVENQMAIALKKLSNLLPVSLIS